MRTDCHIHLDGIGPPHNMAGPTVEEVVLYARRESISLFCGIYEHDETLRKFLRARVPLFPFFWERAPLAPQIPASAKAVKLHPYLENYVLTAENVSPVLLIARERKIPVLVHTDDRKPSLSRGILVAGLAKRFPDVTFIMGHSGSYAPPKKDSPGSSWVKDDLIRVLVGEALEVAVAFPNVFLEVSLLASSVKAQLIAERVPREKVLLGTDFPMDAPVFSSVGFQEDSLLRGGMTHNEIAGIHENARRLFARGLEE